MNETTFRIQPQVAENGDLTIRTGNANPVYQYKGVDYRALSVPSFAELVKQKAVQPNAIVFCHKDGFSAILDDSVREHPFDTVTYDFAFSTLASEWMPVLSKGKVYDIKGLADFLKRRTPGEIKDIEGLVYAVQNFRYVTNISGDFTFADRNNYVFSVKVDEAETTVKVPKTINVSLALLDGDDAISAMEIEVEVHRPANAAEKPGFLLSCPKFERYLDEAKAGARNTLRELLKGWLVVDGEPSAR